MERLDGLSVAAPLAPTAMPMAASAPSGASHTIRYDYQYTGDYRVDVLLDSSPENGDFMSVTSRWNYGLPLGTSPGTITYSFMASVPEYGGNDGVPGATGFAQFTPEQQDAARGIFDRLGKELGIKFAEVFEPQSIGRIRLGDNDEENAGTAGYSWLPNSGSDGVAGYELSGDIWIDYTYDYNFPVVPGSIGYETLLHEVGHSLGLKHPGNYNAGSSAALGQGNFLGHAEDRTDFTVMSYTYRPEASRDWYGMYDLLALKALYGSNPGFNAGDTTHSFTDDDGGTLKIIDDASGNDTLDLSAVSIGAMVDLRPGGFSSVGVDVTGWTDVPAVNNLSIDLTTHIENLIGTNYADHIVLGTGTLTVNGAGGIDTLHYSQAHGAYVVSASGTNLHVTRDGVDDSLSSIERLEFADGKFAFDFANDGNAATTAKILGAIFGQGANPVPAYAGAGLAALDGGMSYDALLDQAITYRFGVSHTHEEFVDVVYSNLANGLLPTPEERDHWVQEINNHNFSEVSLAKFAADSAYNLWWVDLAGQAAHGMEYV